MEVGAMRIGVVGGGAIGLLCSYYLQEQGHTVTIVTKSQQQRNQILAHGVSLESRGKRHHCQLSALTTNEAGEIAVDLWIAAMKQTGIGEFIADWNQLQNKAPILFLQNGMGHLEQAEQLDVPVYAGVVTHGAMRVNHNSVRHTGVGTIFVGNWSNPSNFLLYQLTSPSGGDFTIQHTEEVLYMLKRKLLVNMIVNPLTALYGVKNGALLKTTYWEKNVKQLFLEGSKVLGLTSTEWEYVTTVIQATEQNESSMLTDIKKGNKTEIMAITGYILQQAKKLQLDIPVTEFVHQSILGLEEERMRDE